MRLSPITQGLPKALPHPRPLYSQRGMDAFTVVFGKIFPPTRGSQIGDGGVPHHCVSGINLRQF